MVRGVLDLHYGRVSEFFYKIVMVEIDGKRSSVNDEGNIIEPTTYTATTFTCGFVSFASTNGLGFINSNLFFVTTSIFKSLEGL